MRVGWWEGGVASGLSHRCVTLHRHCDRIALSSLSSRIAVVVSLCCITVVVMSRRCIIAVVIVALHHCVAVLKKAAMTT
jgi:hypothetical protein